MVKRYELWHIDGDMCFSRCSVIIITVETAVVVLYWVKSAVYSFLAFVL